MRRIRISKDLIGYFDLWRKKTNNEFYTFAGPECLKAIAYLLESHDHHFKPQDPIFIKDTCRISKKHRKEVFENVSLLPFAVINYLKRMHDKKHLSPKNNSRWEDKKLLPHI